MTDQISTQAPEETKQGSDEPTAPEKDTRTKAAPAAGVSFLMAAGIAAVFSAFSGFAAFQLATNQAGDAMSNVVVLDSRRLIEGQLDVVIKKGLPPEAAAAEGARIAKAIDTEVAKMVQSGLIVINRSVVIGAPDGVDVTGRVAESIAENAAAQ